MVQTVTGIEQNPSLQIDALALDLAEELRDVKPYKSSFPIRARLKKLDEFFQLAYSHFEKAVKTQVAVSGASEWLLDNYYVLEQAIRVVEDDLPADYYSRLPKTKDDWTRVYILARAILQDTPRLDIEQVKYFIKTFQRTTILQVGEIWALPLMFRLAVMETLAAGLADVTKLEWKSAPDPELWTRITSLADSAGPDSEEMVANSILNLRLIATVDWKDFFDATSVLEKLLQSDPAQLYNKCDFETRNQYRSVIEELAHGSFMPETEIASQTLELAEAAATERQQHVGYYLVAEGRAKLETLIDFRPTMRGRLLRWVRNHATFAYLSSISFLTLLLFSTALWYAIRAGGRPLEIAAVALLAIFPASAVAVDVVNWLVVSLIPPRTLPKLHLKGGVPPEYRTMVVVPALFGTERDITFIIRQLENHFVANSDPNIFFSALTDFADAPEKEMPQDDDLITQAKAEIERLNQKYGYDGYRPFYLFHRERLWNEGEQCWMGWERKRGKLEEFNRLVQESTDTSYTTQFGDLSVLPTIRYVITLDADTLLPRESAQRLIGTLAHVLNHAEFKTASGEIKAGYTILQPRVQVRPAVVNQSLFTRAYSGDSIIDLYTRAVSDVYQDLFGEGNFVGKGIYDVAAFQRSLHDKVPENHLLSHDLFEAVQGSCGLVTDVVLFEDYPPHYLAYTDRLHRWVRGDWQLLPWLGKWIPHRTAARSLNTLSTIDKWRILDNLRRSLIVPAVMALLILGWLVLPGAKLAWMLLALAPYLMPVIINFISAVSRSARGPESNVQARPIQLSTLRSIFEIIFLPHEALIYLDAIATTLTRLYVTHKRMLQWMTAAHTVQLFGKRLHVKSAWQAMLTAPLIAIAVFTAISIIEPGATWFAAPLLAGWLISPYIAARISMPDVQPEIELTPVQEKKVRLLARSTWLYFEHFVSPEDRWLPPDHFQESPRGLVQHQTSPTNIGLMLLSTLAAHDMGYMGATELSLRLRDTFDSMDSLERLRGHFLNWYDTRTFAPLLPRYISTVDSGNLAASLLALKQGCMDIGASPIIQWRGYADTLNMLLHVLEKSNIGKSAGELKEIINSLENQAQVLGDPAQFSPSLLVNLLEDGQTEFEDLLWTAIQNSEEEMSSETWRELSTWVQRVRYQQRHIRTDLQILAPWLITLTDTPSLIAEPGTETELTEAWSELASILSLQPTLGSIPEICEKASQTLERIMELLDAGDSASFNWCEVLAYDLQSALKFSTSLLQDFAALASRAESFFEEMSFGFLYNSSRHVFHIGYNVESGRMDPNYYDLMASESRIASLIAIARGDVPQNHWLYLARPLTELGGKRALLSWSGTMFEYLMPDLFVRSYPNTLMYQSSQVAVEQQIAYAAEKEIPWGISESSYYNFDSAQIYQYQAFGVPHLGYKRGLADHLVVTPYASILALSIATQEVMQNLTWFEKHQMWGLYGLYESVDFTPERLKIGEEYAIVRSYMAHHQGMILLSVHNHLFDKRMVQRFHADPRIRSIELLLQEQTPISAPTEHPRPQQMEMARGGASVNISLDPWRVSADAPYPQIHCLSNGRYTLLISASGSGFSSWDDVELTRWRADATLDDWGTWIYVEDRINGALWSVTPQPTMAPADRSEVSFLPHRVEFERQDGDIVLRTAISVAADDDVEIRRVSITNHGDQPRVFALTSYAEIILTQQSIDQRHPAFNKLFIESEFLAEEQCLLFHRRPRSANEKPFYMAHFFVSNHGQIELSGYETDRRLFLGRGGTDKRPGVFDVTNEASVLSGTTGATLDPICALQAEVAMSAYETAQVAFVTLAAGSRKEALQLVYRYRRWSQVNRAFVDARVHVEKEITQLNITSTDIERFQKLLSPLLYSLPILRANSSVIASNALGQPGLWSFAISGDYPILLVRMKSEEDIHLLHEVMMAYTYWRRRGLMIDVVILNQLASGYDQDLQNKIHRTLNRTGNNDRINKRGGIFILREDQMNESERTLLASAARVILDGQSGSLEEQLSRLDADPIRLPRFVPIENPSEDPLPPIERPVDLLFDNELGGFTPDGREYVIHLAAGQSTPAPWVNVIATPEFGCVVSETGLGCTWAQNSGENRLTPWHNDTVSDPPAEVMYLRDEDTGEIWTPTPLPSRAAEPYLIRHGTGYSIFQHASHGLEQEMRVFVASSEPVKIIQMKLTNSSTRIRRINAVYFAEWVLGTTHENTAPYIVPEYSGGQIALLARNPYSPDFSERVAFLASTREPNGLTADRAEFLGSHGSYARPAALERVGLTPRVEAGVDPCAAIRVLLWLQPGETKEVTFLLGQGADRADAERIIGHFQKIENVQAAWDETSAFWEDMLGQIRVDTPDKAMDLLLNRWLLYQSISSRFWGRTGFYQSSGAFGYRDQLQDAMGYIHARPDLVKQHLLEAASYQFEEGDVLHWWHPPAGRGLRTRCSDDLLWLPFVTAHYVESTGDHSILNMRIPFLHAEPLKPEEHERYGQFPSHTDGTLYDHCCRAIAKGTTAGIHGIPLMGAHDWNDGMNLVGAKGQGESIWLGWFLSSTLTNFAHLCELMNDQARAADYRQQAKKISAANETGGWDGHWYRRAYYDDGSPLGSQQNNECQIDSLAQSWSLLSKGGDSARALQSMEEVYQRLVNHENELILLLTPPFDKTPRNPGYIKGYPPGIRENGGQYTHAALWAIWAFADLGQSDRAHELYRLINPVHHADTLAKAQQYRVEPYVIAADVYSTAPHNGRGGWTWYTGSASWMYRLGVERLLGIDRSAGHLQINPCIPASWKEYQINYRFGKTMYHIRIENPNGATCEVSQITMNGETLSDMKIPLKDDGNVHEVVVTM